MAEQDIKYLENVTSLANTDELLAIVAGLGKNINWANIKEQLAMELPIVTNNSNGIMNPFMFQSLIPDLGRINDCNIKGQYSAVVSGGIKGAPNIEGAVVILSFKGGLPPAYYVQFAIGFNVSYFAMRRHIDTVWLPWQEISLK